MTDRLEQSVKAARSGKTFMESKVFSGDGEPLSAEEVRAAKAYVREHPDISSYHLLMALREHASGTYADIPESTKAKVLCDALVKLTFLNDFGYLEPSESYDGEAAKALLAVGKPSLPCLKALLSNREEAPLFGSEEATISNMYKYRRADFAYRYIMLILGRKPTFPADPKERDTLIGDADILFSTEH